MDYFFENLSDKDRKPVIDIFNYFIENSFAAFPEIKVNYDFFDRILNMSRGYPAITIKDPLSKTIGFAFLHAYHPIEAFQRVAEINGSDISVKDTQGTTITIDENNTVSFYLADTNHQNYLKEKETFPPHFNGISIFNTKYFLVFKGRRISALVCVPAIDDTPFMLCLNVW